MEKTVKESRYLRVGKYEVFCNDNYLDYVTAYNEQDALKIAQYKFGLGREKDLLTVKLIQFVK